MAHRVIWLRSRIWSLLVHSGLREAVRPVDLWVHGLIRIDAKPQRFRADERDEIALPLPGGGIRQRRNQIVIGLRPVWRAAAVLHFAGDENHGIAGHRELALAALAPEFENDFAGVADFDVGNALRSRLTSDIERHFGSERKAIIGCQRRADIHGGSRQQDRRDPCPFQHACEQNHEASRTINAPGAAPF